ncbi:MAG: anti-sigma factor [Gemmatimonadaceae bacterium]
MSHDNELENGTPHGDGASDGVRDGVAREQQDSGLPTHDAEPRYDVAGAALGALAPTEEASLYAAAAADPTVSAELAAMEAVAAELARLAPGAPMNRGRSAGIRSRLVARAAATHAGRPVSKSAVPANDQSAARSASNSAPTAAGSSARRPPGSASVVSGTSPSRHATGAHVIPFEPRSRGGMGRMLGTVALAAAVLIAAFGIYTWRTLPRTGNFETATGAQDSNLAAQVAELRASVAQKDSLIGALTGMHTRVIDLVAYNSTNPMARMFWDQKKEMFIMYASNLKNPPAGKTYQVWLIARGGAAPVSAGTFMPDSTGSAVMTAKHPMQPGTLSRIAVTEEPDGGMPAPTGPVVFSGVGR